MPLTASHDGLDVLDSLELALVCLPKAMLSAKDIKARSSLDEFFCFANLVRGVIIIVVVTVRAVVIIIVVIVPVVVYLLF